MDESQKSRVTLPEIAADAEVPRDSRRPSVAETTPNGLYCGSLFDDVVDLRVIEAIQIAPQSRCGFGVIGFNDVSANTESCLDDRRHSAAPTG